jgi:hypothetical protein
VTVERTRDTWLPRLLSNLSAAAAKQRARRRSRMRVAMTRRWAAARRRRTSEPPVDVSCAATSSRALREQ